MMAESYKVTAVGGSVGIEIQKNKIWLTENSSRILMPGMEIKFLGGKGKAVVTKVVTVLQQKGQEYEVPSQGFFRQFYATARRVIHNFNSPDVTGRAGVTRGGGSSSVISADINVNPDAEYFSFHSTSLFPLPAVLTLYDTNNTTLASYKFDRNDLDPEHKPYEVFFTIPTRLLKKAARYDVVCGRRHHLKLKGKIHLLPSGF